MSLNWKEIDLILQELPLEKSFLQKVEQPDFTSLVLHFYSPGQPFYLFISLAQGRISMHRISQKRPRSVPLQRFSQLLRSRIKGSKLVGVDHPGKERVIRLTFHSPGQETILYVRLWGGAGNIIACDAHGTILDAFYRRPARGEVSGKSFSLPEPQEGDQRRSFSIRDYVDDGLSFPFNRHIEDEWNRSELETGFKALQKQVVAALEKQVTRLESALEKVREKILDSEQSDRYREYGDLILAHQHLIEPGDRELSCSSFFHQGSQILIPLEPTLSPGENGNRYYEMYKKAKRSLQFLEAEQLSLERELEGYNRELQSCREAPVDHESLLRFRQVLQEEKGKKKGAGERKDDTGPGIRFHSSGFTILVGRSAKENDELLRRIVKGNDYWLHARDYPGAYVFIRNVPGKSVPLEVLLDGGNLALFFSRGKSGGKGELYYTQVKHLRRVKEGKTGLVIPTREKNLSIVLDQKRVDRLLGRKEDLP